MKEEPKFDDAAEAPLPRGATVSDPLAAAAAPAAPAAVFLVDAIELAKQRAHEIALALFPPRPPTAIAPLQTLASTAAESQYPKRKFDYAADAPLPHGATGSSSGPASEALAAARAAATAITVDEIELAKQRAFEIASRIFITSEAKRPKVENGETKGFGSTVPDFGSATTTGTAEQQYLEMQLFERIQGTQELTQWPQNQGLSRFL